MSVFLKAIARGDKKSNNLRTEGNITAELYGPDIKNQSLALVYNEFAKAYEEAGESSLVDLELDGKKYNVLITGIQIHPLTGKYIHADLRQVSMTQKIEAEVELKFIGEAPAVKDLGGVFIAGRSTLAIEALPADLINELEVDITGLINFDSQILVKDIKLPKGVTAVDEAEAVIATVSQPMAEEAPIATAEDEKAAIEAVQVTGAKKEGEEGEEPKE
ncbi:MAG: 50S ribosomal protein L25 [Patescibacteria group bacterium]